MQNLDPGVVRAWFAAVPVVELPPHLAVAPDATELAVLARALDRVVAALDCRAAEQPGGPKVCADAATLTSTAASAWLDTYLIGLAAGIAGARAADAAAPGAASPLHLVAGLITAAASTSARIPGRVEVVGGAEAAGVAGSAHRAGAAAAEEAVAGADLHRVAQAAASAAALWRGPVDPADPDLDDRAPRLLARVLQALAFATRPAPANRPLSVRAPGFRERCATDPQRNAGAPFLAEVTFSTVDHPESVHRLAVWLADRGEPFGSWEAGDTRGFHIHTGDPGGVIAEVYSVLTPFDLVIGVLDPGRELPVEAAAP